VLGYFYKHALRWAYEPDDNPLPREAVEQVLGQHKMINMESFLGYLYLWQYSSTRLPLPLPQLERIIPHALSEWNCIKGGSDTITKLLWLNTYDPPCDTPQSHAIARMILLGAVVIHRLNQFFTAKDDLDFYPSLKHFRNAACKRSSFHETLLQIVHSIKQRSIKPILTSSTTNVITGALTRRGDTRTKEVAWGTMATGSTPQRYVKRWYSKDKAATNEEVEVVARMKSCSGVPVYRVCPKTKDYRGEGATGYCIECNRKTNTFCIVCKKWLCNISLAANRGPPQKDKNKLKQNDPKFISITFDDGTLTGKPQKICAIYSCWHKSHQACIEAEGAVVRGQHGDEDSEIP
jgi:hypothetical protein